MKLYLKRDKSDENSRYIVCSESGDEVYKIVGRYSGAFERAYIMRGDVCITKIRDTKLGVLKASFVTMQGLGFHLVVQNSKDRFSASFHGVNLHIRGDVLNRSYDILGVDKSVVSCVCRRFGNSSDTLELNINDDKYELLSIATAVCLNNICTNDALALQAT